MIPKSMQLSFDIMMKESEKTKEDIEQEEKTTLKSLAQDKEDVMRILYRWQATAMGRQNKEQIANCKKILDFIGRITK